MRFQYLISVSEIWSDTNCINDSKQFQFLDYSCIDMPRQNIKPGLEMPKNTELQKQIRTYRARLVLITAGDLFRGELSINQAIL